MTLTIQEKIDAQSVQGYKDPEDFLNQCEVDAGLPATGMSINPQVRAGDVYPRNLNPERYSSNYIDASNYSPILCDEG